MKKFIQYQDYISAMYHADVKMDKHESLTRNVTFQVTDDCTCQCTYCYQGHKGHRMMTKEVGKRGIDLLFRMWDENNDTFINQKTKALIIEFIGGEPLMNIDVIDYICTYFMDECIRRNHPWLYTWRISMISNGSLYFEPKVQDFLKKFSGYISFGVTVDGPKEVHDACRVYPDGTGNFDDAYAALKHFNSTYFQNLGTKCTIAPENLSQMNKIVKFFIDEGMEEINANCVYEAEWTEEQAQYFYKELKKMADYMLSLDKDVYVSLFQDNIGVPMAETEVQNWCGGTMAMLVFDPEGRASPCLRYLKSSLGDDQPELIIGSVDGLFQTQEQCDVRGCLECITRRTQSTDECFYCPIATGCAWCSAWNYQQYGTADKRCTRICVMHKARVLANVYYWNKYYRKNNIEDKRFKMYLPKEDALHFITEDEYNMLLELSKS